MTTPSPFEIARGIGNNLASTITNASDRSAIDDIMEQASKTKNPEDMQQIISRVISRVSPERRQAVLGAVTEKAKQLQSGQQMRDRKDYYEKAGLPPGLASAPESVQAAYIKEDMRAKGDASIFNRASGRNLDEALGGGGGANVAAGGGVDAAAGGGAGVAPGGGVEEVPGGADPSEPEAPQNRGLEDMSDTDLIALSGTNAFGDQAKEVLKKRADLRKEDRADVREAKKATSKFIEDISNKADDARESIRNKKFLIETIDKGDMTDPTLAAFLTSLPGRMGERMLSDDSVIYRAALIDEFKDLRNIFKGQTRNKEIDILEDKMAGLWLNDDQKKGILKSRMRANEIDVIKEEAAEAVMERNPNLGLLGFKKAYNKELQKREQGLFNSILEEQKAIVKQAELRKEIPLDATNPDDLEIMKQIKIEAGGNNKKAFELAKKRGYKFK